MTTIEKKIERINRFPEYSHIKDIQLSVHKIPEENFTPMDPLLCEIFAPDPVTGLPHSDLHVIMSKDSRPEVAQFIRDTLMRPLPDGVRTDNEDDAIDMVKSRQESFVQYAERLRSIVEKADSKEK